VGNDNRVVRFKLRANTVLKLGSTLGIPPLRDAREMRLHLLSNFSQFLIGD
jgi:hypothetical protein